MVTSATPYSPTFQFSTSHLRALCCPSCHSLRLSNGLTGLKPDIVDLTRKMWTRNAKSTSIGHIYYITIALINKRQQQGVEEQANLQSKRSLPAGVICKQSSVRRSSQAGHTMVLNKQQSAMSEKGVSWSNRKRSYKLSPLLFLAPLARPRNRITQRDSQRHPYHAVPAKTSQRRGLKKIICFLVKHKQIATTTIRSALTKSRKRISRQHF